jgi:hypothetical protein
MNPVRRKVLFGQLEGSGAQVPVAPGFRQVHKFVRMMIGLRGGCTRRPLAPRRRERLRRFRRRQ